MKENIDLEKIRNMSDESLKNYLIYLQNKNVSTCAKCYQPNAEYVVLIRQTGKYVSTRKACCLCENCYVKLMNYLELPLIEW